MNFPFRRGRCNLVDLRVPSHSDHAGLGRESHQRGQQRVCNHVSINPAGRYKSQEGDGGVRGGQSCQNGTELSPAVADTGTLSTTWNVVASMTTMLPATSLPDVLLVVMVMTSPTMRLQRQHTAMPSERSGALMGSLSSSHLSTVPSLSSHVGYERETL